MKKKYIECGLKERKKKGRMKERGYPLKREDMNPLSAGRPYNRVLRAGAFGKSDEERDFSIYTAADPIS